jgi:S1-C subfamily serine protease
MGHSMATTGFFSRGSALARLRPALAAALALVFNPCGDFAAADSVGQWPAGIGEILLPFAPVVKKAQPAVVNVYASRTDKRPRKPKKWVYGWKFGYPVEFKQCVRVYGSEPPNRRRACG